MSTYPTDPFFVPNFKMQSGGVDFLGMRQATLDLREFCLPGFSNATQFIRPFSLMCWTYWKLHALSVEAGLETISSDQARIFRERVEILFTWGHKLHSVNGLPGITAEPPIEQLAVGSGSIPLTFSDWKRIPTSTGLMAAVNYGPALKTTSGLGFLNPVATDLFQPLAAGVELAKALDECIRAHHTPPAIDTLNPSMGTQQDALDLFDACNIDTPSDREQGAFRAVFFEQSELSAESLQSSVTLRSATLDLVQSVLRAAGTPLGVEELRESLFDGKLALPELETSSRANSARLRWILLQVRQAQRLAMEAILSWIEKRILYDGAKQTSDLAESAERLCKQDENFKDRDWALFATNRLGREFHGLEDAVRNAVLSPEMSILKRMASLEQLVRAESNDSFPAALDLLGLCREYAVLLEEIPELQEGLRHGGTEGLSLANWNSVCVSTKHLTQYEFILMLIEEHVLSRHFAVATRRYDGGVIRLRITIGEEGLIALVPKPWHPVAALDKLASGLSLMADCGLLARFGAKYAYK